MGMFDHIFININKLPLPESQKKLFNKNQEFQTKDLDNILTEYYITDDNLLMVNKFEYETVPPEERDYPDPNSKFHFFGSMRRINERLEIVDYKGTLNFYTSINKYKQWYEFVATFVNGKMIDIVGGLNYKEEQYKLKIRKEKINKLRKNNG